MEKRYYKLFCSVLLSVLIIFSGCVKRPIIRRHFFSNTDELTPGGLPWWIFKNPESDGTNYFYVGIREKSCDKVVGRTDALMAALSEILIHEGVGFKLDYSKIREETKLAEYQKVKDKISASGLSWLHGAKIAQWGWIENEGRKKPYDVYVQVTYPVQGCEDDKKRIKEMSEKLKLQGYSEGWADEIPYKEDFVSGTKFPSWWGSEWEEWKKKNPGEWGRFVSEWEESEAKARSGAKKNFQQEYPDLPKVEPFDSWVGQSIEHKYIAHFLYNMTEIREEKEKIKKKEKSILEEKLSLPEPLGRLNLGIINYGVCLKYGFGNTFLAEARFVQGSDILAIGARTYINLNPRCYKTLFSIGAEYDHIIFKTEITESSGSGRVEYLFLSMETFLINRLSIVFDMGPAFVQLSENDYKVKHSYNDFMFNFGLNFYIK